MTAPVVFEQKMDLSKLSVSIGMPCGPQIPFQTVMSLAATVKGCAERGIPLSIDLIANCSAVTTARSLVAHSFLQGTASRLFWIDSDIVWTADDFLKLLVLSTRMDVVGATYPLKREGDTKFVIRHPDLVNFDMNEMGCLKVDGMGLGFTVMTREVVEKVAAAKPKMKAGAAHDYSVARIFSDDGVGEDMTFFADIRELGFDVWLDPTIQLGHVGSKVYSGDVVKAMKLEHAYAAAAPDVLTPPTH